MDSVAPDQYVRMRGMILSYTVLTKDPADSDVSQGMQHILVSGYRMLAAYHVIAYTQ